MLDCAQVHKPQQAERVPARSNPTRCAVYFTPQPGTALASFGRSWFGRANDGATLRAFSASGTAWRIDSNVSRWPARNAGLHASFVPPFTLRDDTALEAVRTRLIAFARNRKSIETGPLTLMRAGRTLVLRPVRPRAELDWLATQSFNAFESFAAASGETGREFPHLSPYQQLLLKSFGQPNVMSEYRFSIALTGPLDPSHLERVSQSLRPLIAETCADGIRVDALSLFAGTGPDAPLRLIGRYPMGG